MSVSDSNTSQHESAAPRLPLGEGASAASAALPIAMPRPTHPLHPLAGVVGVFVCGLVAFLTLYATQPLLPLLEGLFHASKSAVGWTVSASTLGVAISAPLLGMFTEHMNRKRVILVSILLLRCAHVCRGHFHIPWLADLLAMAAGAHHARRLCHHHRLHHRKLAAHRGRSCHEHLRQRHRTRGIFRPRDYRRYGRPRRLASVLRIARRDFRFAALTFVAWLLPDRPRSHFQGTRPAFSRLFLPMLGHLRNPRLLTTYLVGFNVLFSLVGVFTYITFYLAAPPFSLSTAKLSLLFVVYLVGLVATPLAGALLPRVGLRTGITGSILLSLAGVLLTLVPSLVVVVAGLALCCTGVFISQSCATSFLREAAPEASRASAVGMYVACYYIGGTVAGVAPSLVWRLGGWTACAAMVAIIDVISIVIARRGWSEPVTA